jgi:hypothetical protein
MWVLTIMAGWPVHVLDVQGAFLYGKFEDGEEIYMKVPKGFEHHYDSNVYWLKFLETLYGHIQAALAFWRKLILAFAKCGFKRSKADPCVFFKWSPAGIIVWVVVVDDCCGTGPPKELLKLKAQLKKIFDCDNQGDMKEYTGCKVKYNKEECFMKILQPVPVQSFKDEFDLKLDELIATPAVPGSTLSKGEPDTTPFQQFKYHSGVGKLIHLAKWSRPEILNAVRDLARHMSTPSTNHLQALDRCMAHVVQTPNRGLVLKPEGFWDGKGKHEFVILGRLDTNYAACPDTRRSVGGHNVFLHQAPTESKCNMQN